MNSFELARKAIHISWGFFIGLVVWFEWVTFWWIVFVFVLLIFGEQFVWHARSPLAKFLKHAEKGGIPRYDMRRITVLGFTVSCFLTYIFFSREVATFAILLLAIGDPLSFFVGWIWGKRKHPTNKKKHLEGSIAAIVTGGVIASLIGIPLFSALAASTIAFVLDGYNTKKVFSYRLDDDFIIPLSAGLVLSLLI